MKTRSGDKEAITASVAALYNAFPFPRVVELEQPLPDDFQRHVFNYALARRPSDALRPGMQVWVAGCGTLQGVQTALSFPTAQVLATDLSAASLAIERDLADQLGVRNIRFEQQNILEARYEEEFDLICCTGVLHHLADPLLGFRTLRRALKPAGAAFLLLYNRQIRRPYTTIQRALADLEPGESLDERLRLSRQLVDAALQSPHCSELHEPLRVIYNTLLEGDAPNFADTFFHPNERDYDIDEMLEFIAEAGCRFSGWLWPGLWDLSRYVSDPALVARAATLSPMAQARLVFELAGRYSPELIFFAERAEAAARPAYTRDELLSMKPLASQGTRRFAVDANHRVTGSSVRPPYEVSGEKIVVRRSPLELKLPRDGEAVFALCDGSRRIDEIAAELEVDEDELLPFLRRALSPEACLVAPIFDP